MHTAEAWRPNSHTLPLMPLVPGDPGKSQKKRSVKHTRAPWERARRGSPSGKVLKPHAQGPCPFL